MSANQDQATNLAYKTIQRDKTAYKCPCGQFPKQRDNDICRACERAIDYANSHQS